jgi:Protein of unknown function, DUF481
LCPHQSIFVRSQDKISIQNVVEFGMNKILVLVLFFPSVLWAQLNESDTLLFQSRFGLTGAWQTGNVEYLAFRGKIDMTLAPSRQFAFKTQNSYLYQEFYNRRADEDIFSRNFIYFNQTKAIYPFAMAFLATNYRREINFRYFAGAGLTWQALRKPNHLLKVALSGIYEQTNYTKSVFNIEEFNGKSQIDTWRATFWLFGKHHFLNHKLIFHYDCYAQPSLQNAANYRWQIETGFDVPIWKGLTISTNYIYTYENLVTDKLKTKDSILTFGLAYQFKK